MENKGRARERVYSVLDGGRRTRAGSGNNTSNNQNSGLGGGSSIPEIDDVEKGD